MEEQQLPPSSPLDNFFSVAFDENTRRNIRTAAQWARIVAICGFISCAITVVVALFGRMNTETYAGVYASSANRGVTVVWTVIWALVGIMINYFLYRFADATVRGMDAMDTIRTNDGFNSLRLYFKVCGIVIIVIISFLVLAFVFFLIGVGLSR